MVNLQAFNAPDSKIFLFLMTTRAGGLGINLQASTRQPLVTPSPPLATPCHPSPSPSPPTPTPTLTITLTLTRPLTRRQSADTCILFDSDWNPQCDLQAMARVHRVGQTRPVHIYRFVSGGTAEERVVQRAQKKLYLSEMVNRGGGGGGEGTDEEELDKMSGAEVLSMIKFGAAAVFAGTNREPTDAELDAIIDRSRTGTDVAVGALTGGKQLDAATMQATFSESAPVATRSLYGQSFDVPESEKGIGKVGEGKFYLFFFTFSKLFFHILKTFFFPRG